MQAPRLSGRAWTVAVYCLANVACFRNVDGTKVRCTGSDHCPSDFVCSGGQCVRRGSVANDGAAPADAKTSALDLAGPGTGGAAGSGGSWDGPLSGNGGTAGTGAAGANDTGESTGSGGAGDTTGGVLGGGGAFGSGGMVASGGIAASGGVLGTGGIATSGGAVAKGGSISSGGVLATGGVVATGGTVSTGGIVSTGGVTSTGGSACVPKARDCTSTLDNNCNGTPDNQETTSCACPVGQTRACEEHAGYDGKGICKAGSQSCAASADKTTSSWGSCSGAVGPGTEVCDAAGLDENCNGQPNEGCECVNGTSIPCDCGPATTCTNGKKGTCSVSKVTMYLDSDGDNYGDPAQPAQVCPSASGYVSNGNDCDDGNPNFKPGVSICTTVTQKKTCPATGGIAAVTPCDQGCINGNCRTDGTIGLPGYVTCTSSNPQRCLAGDGCKTADGTCGWTNESHFTCDGPNDCPGQECWLIAVFGWLEARCQATRPDDSTVYRVCDPLASLCAPPLTCTRFGDYYPIYVCQ